MDLDFLSVLKKQSGVDAMVGPLKERQEGYKRRVSKCQTLLGKEEGVSQLKKMMEITMELNHLIEMLSQFQDGEMLILTRKDMEKGIKMTIDIYSKKFADALGLAGNIEKHDQFNRSLSTFRDFEHMYF